jgi:DNA-binding MarR family transcriptional regulator
MDAQEHKLTAAEVRYLTFIAETFEKTGRTPTSAEIADQMQCTRQYVSTMLTYLGLKGAIAPRPSELKRNEQRLIVLLPRAATLLNRFLPRTMGIRIPRKLPAGAHDDKTGLSE